MAAVNFAPLGAAIRELRGKGGRRGRPGWVDGLREQLDQARLAYRICQGRCGQVGLTGEPYDVAGEYVQLVQCPRCGHVELIPKGRA